MQDRVPSPFGLRLQQARKLVEDLSARELDRLAKLKAEGHTSLIESGVVSNAKIETVRAVARVLGVSLDWLIDGTGEPPTAESVRAAVDAARALRADESGEHAAPGAEVLARVAGS